MMTSLNRLMTEMYAEDILTTIEVKICEHTGSFIARLCDADGYTVMDPKSLAFVRTKGNHDTIGSALGELERIGWCGCRP